MSSENALTYLEAFSNGEQIESQKLLDSLQTMKKAFCLKWFDTNSKNYSSPSKFLEMLWKYILESLQHNNATIKITAYSTIGALLFSLQPFIPVLVTNTFLKAASGFKPTKYISIAIVAVLSDLSKDISILFGECFMMAHKLMEHFSIALKDDLKYLPKLLSNMETTNKGLLESIFVQLTKAFGDTPSINFIYSLVSIVRLDNQILTKSSISSLIDNYPNLYIMLINQILLDLNLCSVITEEMAQKALDLSIKAIFSKEPFLNLFEQSCSCIANVSIRFPGIKIEQDFTPTTFPEHFRIFTYKLPNKLQCITPNLNDSKSVQSAKLIGISYYIRRQSNIEKYAEGIEAIKSCLNADGEVLSNLIEGLITVYSEIPSFILNTSVFLDLGEILENLIDRQYKNWVQEVALCNLIASIPLKLCVQFSYGLRRKRIIVCMRHSLSKQKPLANAGLTAITKTAKISDVRIITEFIYSTDLLDPAIFARCIDVINSVKIPQVYFIGLAPLLSEGFSFHMSITASAALFKFFNTINYKDESLKSRAIDLVAKLYTSLTGNEVDQSLGVLDSMELPPMMEYIDTDIITRAADDQMFYMDALKEALKYSSMFECSEHLKVIACILLKAFPDEALSVIKEGGAIPDGIKDLFVIRAVELLKTAPTVRSAGLIVSAISSLGLADDEIKKTVDAYMDSGLVTDGRDLCNFLGLAEKSSAMECLTKMDDTNVIKFNLLSGFALAPVQVENAEVSLLKGYDFSLWPIHDKQIVQIISRVIDKLSPISFSGELDRAHLQFYRRFSEYFAVRSPSRRFFDFVSVGNDKPKSPSILTSIMKGEAIRDKALLRSFLLHSNYRLNRDQMRDIQGYALECRLCNDLIRYSTRTNSPLNISLSDLKEESMPLYAHYLVQTGSKDREFKKFMKEQSEVYPNPILSDSPIAKALVEFKPDACYDIFLRKFDNTKHSYQSLLDFVSRFGHRYEKDRAIFQQFYSLERPNPKVVRRFLKFSLSFFDSVMHHLEIKWLTNFCLDFAGRILAMKVESSSFRDLSLIFYLLSTIEPKTHRYTSKAGAECRSLFLKNYARTNSASPSDISTAMQSPQPSRKLCALRAVALLCGNNTNSSQIWSCFNFIQSKEFRREDIFYVYELSNLLRAMQKNKLPLLQKTIVPALDKLSADNILYQKLKEEFGTKDEEEDSTKRSIISIVNRFFTGAEDILPSGAVDAISSEMAGVSAAYFMVGQVDGLKAHFFDLYVITGRVISRLSPEDSQTFRGFAASQLIPAITHKKRGKALAKLVGGSVIERLEGADLASSINF